MKYTYVYKGDNMGKFKCITMSGKGHEHDRCLAGPNGEIWEDEGGGAFKAVKFNPQGNDKIFSFKSKDLNKWVLRLNIPVDPLEQCAYANRRI